MAASANVSLFGDGKSEPLATSDSVRRHKSCLHVRSTEPRRRYGQRRPSPAASAAAASADGRAVVEPVAVASVPLRTVSRRPSQVGECACVSSGIGAGRAASGTCRNKTADSGSSQGQTSHGRHGVLPKSAVSPIPQVASHTALNMRVRHILPALHETPTTPMCLHQARHLHCQLDVEEHDVPSMFAGYSPTVHGSAVVRISTTWRTVEIEEFICVSASSTEYAQRSPLRTIALGITCRFTTAPVVVSSACRKCQHQTPNN